MKPPSTTTPKLASPPYTASDCYAWLLGLQTYLYGLRPTRLHQDDETATSFTPARRFACAPLRSRLSPAGCASHVAVVAFGTAATVLFFGYPSHYPPTHIVGFATSHMGQLQSLCVRLVYQLAAVHTCTAVWWHEPLQRRIGDLLRAADRQLECSERTAVRAAAATKARAAASSWLRWMRGACFVTLHVHLVFLVYLTYRSDATSPKGLTARVGVLIIPYMFRQVAVLAFAYQLAVVGARWWRLNAVLVRVVAEMERKAGGWQLKEQ